MRSPRTVHRTAAAIAVAASALTGCSLLDRGDDTATDTADAAVPDISVAVPPSRLTPFCRALTDLAAELQNDPPDDEGARILEVYESVADEAPADIRADFLAVLAALQSGGTATAGTTSPPSAVTTSAGATTEVATTTETPATTDAPGESATATASGVTGSTGPASSTTTPLFDEGYLPDDDPAGRVNAWIQANCQGTQNNPGPAPTQPLESTSSASED